jgi:hypothetical protein
VYLFKLLTLSHTSNQSILMSRAVIADSSSSNDSRRTEIEFGYDDDSVNINHGNVKGENATARASKRERKRLLNENLIN